MTVLLLSAGCVGTPTERVESGGDSAFSQVDWADVAPIMAEHCVGCHQPGLNDLPLTRYAEVAALAPLVAAKMAGSPDAPYIMPPWSPPDVEGCSPTGGYVDDPRPSSEEIATVTAWASNGAPLGEGDPALVISVPNAYQLTGSGVVSLPPVEIQVPARTTTSDYRHCLSLPLGLTSEGYLEALAIRPDPGHGIHHIVVSTDPQGLSAPEGDPNVVADCDGSEVPNSKMLFTYIGQTEPFVFPPDSAMTLQPGARLLLAYHYHQGDEPYADATSLDVRWAAAPPTFEAWMERFGGATENQADISPTGYRGGWADGHFLIPAGETDHAETWLEKWGNPEGTDGSPEGEYPIWAVFPHMHYVGRKIEMTLHKSTGESICLANITEFDAAWQQHYRYAGELPELPVIAPEDQIEIECHYDNSLENDRLRAALVEDGRAVPEDVSVGEGAFDEMCVMHFGVLKRRE